VEDDAAVLETPADVLLYKNTSELDVNQEVGIEELLLQLVYQVLDEVSGVKDCDTMLPELIVFGSASEVLVIVTALVAEGDMVEELALPEGARNPTGFERFIPGTDVLVTAVEELTPEDRIVEEVVPALDDVSHGLSESLLVLLPIMLAPVLLVFEMVS